jgi:hypothetical protein
MDRRGEDRYAVGVAKSSGFHCEPIGRPCGGRRLVGAKAVEVESKGLKEVDVSSCGEVRMHKQGQGSARGKRYRRGSI